FSGVLKAVFDIEGIVSILKNAEKTETYRSARFVLASSRGRLIYSTGAYSMLSPLPQGIAYQIMGSQARQKLNGYFVHGGSGSGDPEELVVYARSGGFKSFEGLGWVLIVEYNTAEVFGPLARLRQRIWMTFIGAAVFAVLLSVFIAKSISDPISKLKDVAAEIGRGNLETVIKVKSDDEIGQLAGSLRKMAENLRRTTVSRNMLLKEIEGRKKVEGDLRESRERLEDKTKELDRSLREAIESRKILTSMLEDNNLIRETLERNIYELKQAQNQLIQSEKLASLGKLLSEVAHEVNNPLMVISGRAQLSLMDDHCNKELEDNLRIISDQCQRAKDIIQRLLLFTKPSIEEVKETDINGAVEFVIKLLEHQYMLSNIKIRRDYVLPPPIIEIDEKRLQEALVNIVKNAGEAMPEGGAITVKTSVDKDNVRISVKDTGMGIPLENINKLFDPFFTTKKDGTGPGLSVCYGIIKAFKGDLKYESKPGKGTTAVIVLPIKG
ncbi:MAG: ATP-binding protein, partial [Candidatus Omnitrophota bacterium]